MALALAVRCALGAAVAYGGSTAVQHSAAHTGSRRVDGRRLLRLARDQPGRAAALACLAVRRGGARLRAGVYGAVAGTLFGVAAVLITAVSSVWADQGVAGFRTVNGLVPLVVALVVGGVGMALTQVSFQVGALAASIPANESAAPTVAVLLGGLLLREHVPSSIPILICYLICLAAVAAGAIRIAAECTC